MTKTRYTSIVPMLYTNSNHLTEYFSCKYYRKIKINFTYVLVFVLVLVLVLALALALALAWMKLELDKITTLITC